MYLDIVTRKCWIKKAFLSFFLSFSRRDNTPRTYIQRTLRIQRMTCCPVLGSCLSFMSGFLSSGLYRRLCKCRRDFFHHLLHGNMQSNFAAFETAVSGIAMWIGINELNLYCVFFYAYLEYLNRPPMIRSLFQFFFFFFFSNSNGNGATKSATNLRTSRKKDCRAISDTRTRSMGWFSIIKNELR